MQRDQGVYAACGSILLHGGAPYNDCWDTKGPLTHYTYALAQLPFGINLSGPVILSAILTGLTGVVLWRIARHWFGDPLAWATGLLYSLIVVSIPFDMNAQSEGFANLFIAFGVWGILIHHSNNESSAIPKRDVLGRAGESLPNKRQGESFLAASRLAITLNNKFPHWLLWLAGASFAFAFAYKYTIILPITVAALGALLTTQSPNRETPHIPRLTAHAFRSMLQLSVAFLATLFLFTLYLLFRGALGLAFEHLTFMLTEFPKVAVNPTLLLFPGESGPPLFYWQRTVLQFMRLPIIHIFGLIGCLIALIKKRVWVWPITLWLAAALASVYPQKVMTLYHWTLSLAPLSLAVGAFIWEFKEALTHLLSTFLRLLTTAFCLLLIIANLAVRFYEDQWLVSAKYLTGQQTLKEFYDSQAIGDEIDVANYIRDRTTPDELIWVWGNHSIMYYWADRRSPTRFIFNSPIMAAIGPNDFQPRWKTEVLNALEQHPPTYIVITYFDRTWFDYENPVDEFKEIPGYQDFLDRYYRQESFIGRFAIYRLTPWWSRYNYPTLLGAVTAYDLLGNIDSAILASAPNEPIQSTEFKLYDESPYPTLLMHPEAKAVFKLTLPDGVVCFRSDLALDPQSWGWGGDGANFVLAVDGEKVFEQYVGNAVTDRFWQPINVDLSRWAGQSVTLTLATGPGPNSDFTGDRAGWGLPRIVQSPGDRCDARAIIK
jgi:hypothetical protein